MLDYSSLSDEALVQCIARHDQTALSQLYDRYGTPVYSLVLRIVQDAKLAEEATQDTFVKVWRNPERWDPDKGRFVSWLLTVARYTAIDLLRAELRQVTAHASSLDGTHIKPGTDPVDNPALNDNRLLYALLDELPPEQAQLVRLGFFQGMTHKQLAETLNLPLGTVKTRVRLGLQKLRVLWLEATRQHE